VDEEAVAKQDATLEPIMHDWQDKASILNMKTIFIFITAAVLGLGSGLALARSGRTFPANTAETPKAGAIETGKKYGSDDTKTFRDTAEGILREGGIDGEGQYHLERPGGPSKNVYLTSSVVDLSLFKGKRVKVWGETQKAQKAGWLMDVGRVQVL
jgi:hypothetical protein